MKGIQKWRTGEGEQRRCPVNQGRKWEMIRKREEQKRTMIGSKVRLI